MSTKQTKLSSRRARRRRAQGSKATASILDRIQEMKSAPRSRRRQPRKASVRVVSDRLGISRNSASFPGYQQMAIAGVGSSLTHTFNYAHYQQGRVKGVRVSGICPIAFGYYQGAGSINGFQTLASFSSTQVLPLNPQYLFASNSNEYGLMNTMTKFRFNKVKMVYASHVNSTVVGNLYFGYYADGGIQNGDVSSFITLVQPGTISCQVWATNVGTDLTQYLDRSWYYVDADVGTDAGLRQTEQGDLTAIWGILPTAIQSYGLFYLDYEIDLIEPRANLNLTLSKNLSSSDRLIYRDLEIKKRKDVKTAELKEVHALLEQLRLDNPPEEKGPVGGSQDPVYKSYSSADGSTTTFQLQPIQVEDQGIIPVPSPVPSERKLGKKR